MNEALVAALQHVVGTEHLLANAAAREEHSLDAYMLWRGPEAGGGVADVVVRPGSVEQVQQTLRLASAERLAVIPLGGGSGVMGSAVPLAGGLVLDMRRLAEVQAVSAVGGTVSVGAGALLGSVDAALQPHGLRIGHDPWSQSIASIGGAISTNGVGYLAARHGTMGEQVLGLKVVLANGELLDTKGVSKTAGPGYKQLFIGAEGALGVIVEATIRAFPVPATRQLLAVEFASFGAGYQAILGLEQAGSRLAMIDYTEEPALGTCVLQLAFEGDRERTAFERQAGLRICRLEGGRDLGPGIAQEFWETRHASAESWKARVSAGRRAARARGRARWGFDYLHVALPQDLIPSYRVWCLEYLTKQGLEVSEFGIWGRSDLFSVAFGIPAGQSSSAAAQASRVLLYRVQDLGGSMEYCHGVGLKLVEHMQREWGASAATLRAIKAALDPLGIMNPGKLWV